MQPAYVFMRDDDVWRQDENFRELFPVLVKKRIPVVYGVIPGRLQLGMARFLSQAKRRYPDLLDLVQHGYRHANHAAPGQAKYEFGPARTYAQQYRDLHRGVKIMRELLGPVLTPGFIPPYHGHDAHTLKALAALKVPLFSAGGPVVLPAGCLDAPARVALNDYASDSTPLAYDLENMLRRSARALRPGKLTGLLYHHRAMRTSKDRKAFKAFLSALAYWRDEGRVRMVLFSDLLRHRGQAFRDLTRRSCDQIR